MQTQTAKQQTPRESDAETGPCYYRARYYSPSLQRFISEDPIRLKSKTINFYQYAYNNPANLRDPFGLYTLQLGLNLSGVLPIGPVGITYSASVGLAVDSQGHFSWYDSYTPVYLPGLGEGLSGQGGISVAVSNAHTVCGLGGPFLNVSGTGGYTGIAGTADYFTGAGDGPNGVVDGAGGTLGIGGGGSASVMVTATDVHPFGRYSCGEDGKIHAR
jgi:RHS repeat-associated protein